MNPRIKATDLINKNDFVMYSKYRLGTVVSISRKLINFRQETEQDYRHRCKLDSRTIGVALNDALPSQLVSIDMIDYQATTAAGDRCN